MPITADLEPQGVRKKIAHILDLSRGSAFHMGTSGFDPVVQKKKTNIQNMVGVSVELLRSLVAYAI